MQHLVNKEIDNHECTLDRGVRNSDSIILSAYRKVRNIFAAMPHICPYFQSMHPAFPFLMFAFWYAAAAFIGTKVASALGGPWRLESST